MAHKFRTALALQPLATALFSNSPFTEGKPNGFLSYRSHIWSDTDPHRTGMLPFVFKDGFGYERYAEYMLDVPMYFVFRDGKYIDAAGQSFRDFLKGKLPALPASAARERLDRSLSTASPRWLKSFSRCAAPTEGHGAHLRSPCLLGRAALRPGRARAAWALVKDWTMDEREALRNAVRSWSWTPPSRRRQAARPRPKCCGRPRRLTARASLNASGATKPASRHAGGIVASGKVPRSASRPYYEEWSGDVSRVYKYSF